MILISYMSYLVQVFQLVVFIWRPLAPSFSVEYFIIISFYVVCYAENK